MVRKQDKKYTRRVRGDVLVPNFIAEWRVYRGFQSQYALAKACGFPAKTINKLEAHTLAYTAHTLGVLAAVLKCHEGDLISRDPNKDADIFAIYGRLKPAQQKRVTKAIKAEIGNTEL